MPDQAKPTETPPEKGAGFQRKTDRILQTARQLFTEHGFTNTSMDRVAATAKVSKTTVYQHFRDKDALFTAVIGLEARDHTMALKAPTETDFATKLHQVALEAFDLLLSDTSIAVYRTIAAETARAPLLGRTFHQTGPAVIIRLIGDFLAEAVQSGHLRPLDPQLAATHLLGLIISDLQVRALLGQPVTLTAADRTYFVTRGLEVFLSGYGSLATPDQL